MRVSAFSTVRWTRLVVVLSGLMLLATAAFSQGFLVKPMSVEVTVKQGGSYNVPIEVVNTATDRKSSVDVSLQYLGQDESGWTVAEKDKITPEERSRFASSVSWSDIDKSALDIDPLQTGTVMLRMNVPPSAHGFYSSAIVIQSRRAPGAGVGLVIRFLIPVLIDVEGSTPSRLADPTKGMIRYLPATGQQPNSVSMGVMVHNQGQGLIRVTGKLSLYGLVGTQWLRVTSADAVPRRILPGASVFVTASAPKRIPSGHYRVEADLKTDSQNLKHFSEEMDVQGDASVAAITPDATLVAEPSPVEVEGQAGALRSITVGLRNAGDDPITVNLSAGIPPELQGVAIGDFKGDALSAGDWTTVSPSTLTIAAHQVRNVRVTVACPDSATRPYYYSLLSAQISKNGEPAGASKILVVTHTKGQTASLSMLPSSPISLSREAGGAYSLLAAFANNGEMHLMPHASFSITDTAGLTQFKQIDSETDAGTILPLSIARFSAALDPKGLKPGSYALTATCTYGDGKTAKAVAAIKVTAGPKGNTIEILSSSKQK
ncbi:MAG TPA: hypothetical protein VG944_09320 [Fimbriimonas sp.]|nr:hypothetical protein [Fimbriimonas sp.]